LNKKLFIILFVLFTFSIFGNTIAFDFIDVDLKDALDEIAFAADVQIVYSESVSGKVDLLINTNNVETALELILFGKPFFFEKYSEDIYFVGDYRERTNLANYLLEPNVVKLSNISTNSISELLSLYPYRVKFLKDSNLVIVYGKDEIATKIIEMIRDIDNNSYTNKILAVNIIELSEAQWKVKEANNITIDFIVGKNNGTNFEFLNFEQNLRYNYYNVFKNENEMSFVFYDKKVDISVVENDGIDLKLLIDDSLILDLNLSYSQMNTPIYYFMNNSNKYFMIVLGVYEKRDYTNYFQEKNSNSIGLEYEFDKGNDYIGLDFITNDYKLNFKYGFFDKYKFTFTDEISKDFYSNVGIDYHDDLLYFLLSFKEYQHFEEIILNGEIGLLSNIRFESNSLNPSFDGLFYDIFIGYENDTIELGAGADIYFNISNIKINPYSELKFNYEYEKFELVGELLYIINKGFKVNTKIFYNF